MMKSTQPDIKGSKKPIYSNYKALPTKYMRDNCVFKNMINEEREYINISNATMDEGGRKILWALREYSNACYFILNLSTIEKELYKIDESSRDLFFLKKISSLLCDENFSKTEREYKLRKISHDSMIPIFREYICIFQKIYNNLKNDKYMIILRTTKKIFNEVNKMIFNFII